MKTSLGGLLCAVLSFLAAAEVLLVALVEPAPWAVANALLAMAVWLLAADTIEAISRA